MSNASVQVRLGLEAIEDRVVRLVGGEYRAVLEAMGTANPLEDDVRQEALLAGFATFLNALGFPIQVVVRSTPVDLAPYVTALEERARHALPPELSGLAADHAAFVQRLARQRTLLERRFYVVVPAASVQRSTWLGRVLRRPAVESAADADAARRQLAFRCDDVIRQLTRCGVAARRLGDLELAQLYLACWAPERARVQRIRQRLDDYTTLAVRSERALAAEA